MKYFRFYFIFYVKTTVPAEKGHPSISPQPPLKIEVLYSPPPLRSPFFENLVGGLIRRLSSPQQEGSAGAHYEKRCFYWVRRLLKDK